MTERSMFLLEAGVTPCRARLTAQRMSDGDGKRQKLRVCCFDTEHEGSDEQCGAECETITCSAHGSVGSALRETCGW